jgi:hypothetical protein
MPVHEHDCPHCQFLGTRPSIMGNDDGTPMVGMIDHYCCPGGISGPTLVARWGPCGDYSSQPRERVEAEAAGSSRPWPRNYWGINLLVTLILLRAEEAREE